MKPRVALVTGAASGIGRAVARRLQGMGISVFAVDRQPEALGALAAEPPAGAPTPGGRLVLHVADVGHPEAGEAIVGACTTRLGPPDALVNSAGILAGTPLLGHHEEDWRRLLEVNLFGTLRLSQAFARRILSRRQGGEPAEGRIVNLASIAGTVARVGLAAYGATKAAVIHLTKTCAVEWAGHGIAVNAVAPGPTDTPMLRESLLKGDAAAVARVVQGDPERFRVGIPIGRLIAADEVAEVVAFLVTAPLAVTGNVIYVDGGQSAL